MEVKKGNKVTVEYEGSFENGDVFDSSKNHGKPLEFVAGEGRVVKGFDEAIMGMKIDEEKSITIAPEDGYGQVNPEAIQKIPVAQFPKGAEVGMAVGIPLPNGQQAPAKITAMDEENVTLDLNHPLAGKTLLFKIKVIGILE